MLFVKIIVGHHNSWQSEKRKHNHEAIQPSFLPHALVRRIMCIDPDVQRVSADAIASMARVACLYLDLLAEKSFIAASQVGFLWLDFPHIVGIISSSSTLMTYTKSGKW